MASQEKPQIDAKAIEAFINDQAAENADEVVRKYEAESRFRKFSGMMGKLVAAICSCFISTPQASASLKPSSSETST